MIGQKPKGKKLMRVKVGKPVLPSNGRNGTRINRQNISARIAQAHTRDSEHTDNNGHAGNNGHVDYSKQMTTHPVLSGHRTDLKQEIINKKLAVFLKELATHGIVWQACEAAQIARRTVYDIVARDEQFAAAWKEALAIAADVVEREVWRRAIEGWEEPQFWKGELQGVVRKYDGQLLQMLAKGHKPERFRERREITGANGGPLKAEFKFEESEIIEIGQILLDLGVDINE